MTVRMIDGAYPPSDASLHALYAEGHRVIAGYLPGTGGWHPYNVWAKSDFDRCRAAGFVVIGVYFGPDAGHALAVAQQYGIDTLALDVEANDIGAYAPGVGDAWRGRVRSVCYGLRSRIGGWAQHFDALWFAEYGKKPATVAPRTAVQWWNSHTDAGAGVDESLADDWFAGPTATTGETVDPQLKSALIRLCAYAVLGRNDIDQASWDGWHANLSTVTDPDFLVSSFTATPEAAAYRARIAAGGPPGPAGKDGAPGVMAAHTHTVSGSAS